MADVPPASGTRKRPRSPTPNGDTRKVSPRKSSPAPIAERRQDLPATPVLSNITQPTTPTLTISLVAQKREKDGSSVGVVGPSSSLGPSVYRWQEPLTASGSSLAQQRTNVDSSVGIVAPSSSLGTSVYRWQEPLTPSGSGRASINLSAGLARTSSLLSDMNISRSSTPPIVVLKTESASGTNSSNSRKASEARTEDDEMVDELAPFFGKEMRVLSMFKPYDIPGEFTLDCFLLDADWNKISTWVRAPVDIECVSVPLSLRMLIFSPSSLDISQARCISLACYSVQDLEPHTDQQDASREPWFENARPVPWPKIPRHLWFLVNDEFTILYPPYEVGISSSHPPAYWPLTGLFFVKAEEDLFDLSPYLRPGQNKIAFTQIDSMADYVLVVHGHYPTRKQIARVRARWDERKRFREQLAWLARPISPTI